MEKSIMDHILEQIYWARRNHAKKPDFIILGMKEKLELLSLPSSLLYEYIAQTNVIKIAGVDVAWSTRESELSVGYTERRSY